MAEAKFKSESEYLQYYRDYPPTKPEYKEKDWEHDLRVAHARADLYNLPILANQRILDVGSGSGAFVYWCRQLGHPAFGCEIATYHYDQCPQWTYRGRLETLGLTERSFDMVTCHDVLEHAMDPVAMLMEMVRVTRHGGLCMIEIPRFFHESGAHHWKDAEHLWYWTTFQLYGLLEQAGMTVESVLHPIESKTLFSCLTP